MKRIQWYEVEGTTYDTRNGNTISVTKDKITVGNGVTTFIAECSVCSKDTELWPYGSITVTIRNIRNKVSSCGCSIYTRYSENQREIQVKRCIDGKGWDFIKIINPELSSTRSRVLLENPVTGDFWKPLLSNVIKNSVRLAPHSDIEIIKFFNEVKHLYPNGTILKPNLLCKRKKFLLSCPLCGESDIPVRKENLRKGIRSCKCSSKNYGWYPYRSEEEDNLYLIDMSNDEEHFVKIGRSFNVTHRLKNLRKSHYKVKELSTISGNHTMVCSKEKEIHNILTSEGFHYLPDKPFGGSISECFIVSSIDEHIVKETFKTIDIKS